MDRIDIDKPLWDQSTYIGRLKHFAFITDCRTIVPEKELRKAEQLCDDYRNGREPSGTALKDVIRAKQLKDSAFHPDNDKLMSPLGRMSYQLPTSVIISTAMLTFYKSTLAAVLCQIMGQTHNTILNYTNRNITETDNDDINTARTAFLCTVLASSVVAVACKKILYQRCSPLIVTRCVPFIAVTTGHMINLPLMRQREIKTGTPLFVEGAEKPFMRSRIAAVKGISECIITRIVMSTPCLLFIPIITQMIKPYCFYQRRPWIIYPIEACLCALGYVFMIPASFALFPRCNSMNPELLKLHQPEYEEYRENIKEDVDKVYYNKGL